MLYKKLFCLLLCLCLTAFPVAAAEHTVSSECDLGDVNEPLETASVAAAVGQTLDIKAKSAFLIEPYTGTVLYESNADEVLPPASITKIMSLLLIMEAIDRGVLTRETVISASEHACSMGGSQIWLEPGEGMSVDDLLKATVIASANDATVALGEAVAGSEEGFVAMMNARAGELGMTKTHFVNCTGLDAEGHVTTAHDVGLMAAALIQHALIKEYSTVWMDSLRDGKSELVNTNRLVRFYPGTTGLKTGTTSGAGYCLAATAERDGMELAAVIMGGDTSNDRFNGAKKLLDFGFANYCFTTVEPQLEKDLKLAVKKGTERTVGVKPGKPVGLLTAKTAAKDLKQVCTLPKSIAAPVKKDQVIGTVEVYNGDEQVAVIELLADHTVEKMTLWVALRRILRGIVTP